MLSKSELRRELACEPMALVQRCFDQSKEITQLREALEWYALNVEVMACGPDFDASIAAGDDLTRDAGHRARVALAK